jgi:hypothetical protein
MSGPGTVAHFSSISDPKAATDARARILSEAAQHVPAAEAQAA